MREFLDLLNAWPPSYALIALVLAGLGYGIWSFVCRYGADLIGAYREIRRQKAAERTHTNGVVFRDAVLEQNRRLLNEVVAVQTGAERQTAQFLAVMIDQQDLLISLMSRFEQLNEVLRQIAHQLKQNERISESVWFMLTTIYGASGGDIRKLVERAMRELATEGQIQDGVS